MPTHYFLGPKLIASTRQLALWSDTSIELSNLALCCPTCGSIWGRVLTDCATSHEFVKRGCAQHPWIEDVGATFIAPWRSAFDELPPEVLQYELDIRLNQREQES